MPTFRTVEFWPLGGLPDAPWCVDPDEDAFVRSGRRVCELYSEGLLPARIPARCPVLRMPCTHDHLRADVEVVVCTEPLEGFEIARVALPDGIAELDGDDRARLVLDVVHGATVRLAEARGWEVAALEAARAHVLERGMRYRWAGPAKASPDRRHTARPLYDLWDDGFGRVTVEVRRRDDLVVVAVSDPALAFSTSEGFRRSARTLRWRGNAIVELVPYSGIFGESSGLVTVDLGAALADGAALRPLAFPAEVRRPRSHGLPVVSVRGEGANAPEDGPSIRVVGGGPGGACPRSYHTALGLLLHAIGAPEWVAWWSGAEDDVLEIWCDFAAAKAGTTVRRAANKVRVTIRRPSGTFTDADPVAMARADVEAMLTTVRTRTGLGPHPSLMTALDLAVRTAQVHADEEERRARSSALVAQLADRLPAWLVRAFATDAAEGRAFVNDLRVQLVHLGVTTTVDERLEVEALGADEDA